MEEFERRLFQSALDIGNSTTRVASVLGVSPAYVQKRLLALGLRTITKKRKRRTAAQKKAQAASMAHARAVKNARRDAQREAQREARRERNAARIAVEDAARPETAPVPENGSPEGPGGST